MKRRSLILLAFCLLIAAPSATYAQFSYPNFSSTNGLRLDGGATVVSNAIQLTMLHTNATASAFWYKTPVGVGSGFSTTFSYAIHPADGADGITFVIQNDPNGPRAVGGDGGALGAGGIRNAVAIAFRTYLFNDVEIDSCGAGSAISIGSCVIAQIPESALSGTHTVQISQSGGTLKVSLDGNQILSGPINLASAVGGNTAYVGITGADGSASETAMITSWSVTPGASLALTPVPSSIWLALLGLTLTVCYFRFRSRAIVRLQP